MEVSIEEIEYLRGLRFTWTKIAILLGISRSTLYRRLEEEGINLTSTYSTIADNDLDRVVVAIKREHPNDGERLMIGHLRHIGIILPRSRIRACIHRVDPINTALRRSVTVRRRVYCVSGPNALWHIDGHHKMIKWRFVVHGGIDGYSRTIVFLRCSTNNRASTMMSAFYDGVTKYGLPNQVRSDRGGENMHVWHYMYDQHQSESGIIVGSSTHNERIERLWRDVHRCVAVIYADLFRRMEDDGNLDTLNEIDLFCLHVVYLQRINETLDSFVECWNNHPISTEHNVTPNQLFIQGALNQSMTPTLHDPSRTSNGFQLPTVRSSVAVPRSTFIPCAGLVHDIYINWTCLELLMISPIPYLKDYAA